LTVADKTGSAPHRSNDIGLLTGPDGRTVIVAVYATETTAADSVVDGVIAQVAGALTR
jgi:beta-lactamase class A